MAKLEIVFAQNAENQLHEILDTFRIKTRSGTRSINIYKMFKNHLAKVADEPETGMKTPAKGVRGVYAEDYILFYDAKPGKIVVLKIWDCSKHVENSGI